MAKSDYALCEHCGGKVFYDADTDTGGAAIWHRECVFTVKAEAWDTGWNAGYDDRIVHGDEQNPDYTPNPYREKEAGA